MCLTGRCVGNEALCARLAVMCSLCVCAKRRYVVLMEMYRAVFAPTELFIRECN